MYGALPGDGGWSVSWISVGEMMMDPHKTLYPQRILKQKTDTCSGILFLIKRRLSFEKGNIEDDTKSFILC